VIHFTEPPYGDSFDEYSEVTVDIFKNVKKAEETLCVSSFASNPP
jgi:hypothetical protein